MKIGTLKYSYPHAAAKKMVETLQISDPEWSYLAIPTNEEMSRIEVRDEDGEIIETHYCF